MEASISDSSLYPDPALSRSEISICPTIVKIAKHWPGFQIHGTITYLATCNGEDDVEADPERGGSWDNGRPIAQDLLPLSGHQCVLRTRATVSQFWQRQDVDEAAWCTVLCPCRSWFRLDILLVSSAPPPVVNCVVLRKLLFKSLATQVRTTLGN